MKVLLTGATGFVGSEIARELVRAGHSLKILVRKTSKLDALAGLAFEKVEGDITDRASVERALEGVDALIHTAANVGSRKRDKDPLYLVNVEGTRNVLEAAHAKGGLRVVYTSSIAAVGASRDETPLDEKSAWTVGGTGYHYVDSKWQAEQVAFDLAKRGLDVVVLNPGFVLGPGDTYLTSTRLVLELVQGRIPGITAGGISFCDVRSVAKAHVAALTRGKKGERYILAGMNHSYEDLLRRGAKLAGIKAPRRIPYAFAWLLAVASEAASLFVKHSLEEVNRPVIAYSRLWAYMDSTRAAKELGYVVGDVDQSLRDTIASFVRRGLVKATTPELQAMLAAAGPAPASVPAPAATGTREPVGV